MNLEFRAAPDVPKYAEDLTNLTVFKRSKDGLHWLRVMNGALCMSADNDWTYVPFTPDDRVIIHSVVGFLQYWP